MVLSAVLDDLILLKRMKFILLSGYFEMAKIDRESLFLVKERTVLNIFMVMRLNLFKCNKK